MIDPDDTDDTDELDRWVRISNRTRGYGGVFNYATADDKEIVELSTADDWCRSIAAEFGLTVGEPESNPDDPPDCYVSVGGKRLGIELVQLVDREHKRRAALGETPYAGKFFQDTQ